MKTITKQQKNILAAIPKSFQKFLAPLIFNANLNLESITAITASTGATLYISESIIKCFTCLSDQMTCSYLYLKFLFNGGGPMLRFSKVYYHNCIFQQSFQGGYNHSSRPALFRLPQWCRCRRGSRCRRHYTGGPSSTPTSSTPAPSSIPAHLPRPVQTRVFVLKRVPGQTSSTPAPSSTPVLVLAGIGKFQVAGAPAQRYDYTLPKIFNKLYLTLTPTIRLTILNSF